MAAPANNSGGYSAWSSLAAIAVMLVVPGEFGPVAVAP